MRPSLNDHHSRKVTSNSWKTNGDGTKSRGKSLSLDFLFLRTAHPSKYKFSIQKCILSTLKEHFGLNCKYKSFYLMENGVLQCMSFFHFSYQSHTCTSMLSTNTVREWVFRWFFMFSLSATRRRQTSKPKSMFPLIRCGSNFSEWFDTNLEIYFV